ncbi:branched-chain amino acid transport system permease protein [Arthrobacter sp. V4I6]|uniref:branched-chain amino acid ABC transporter permease n=1 Tax=unclassified Arthrobacter TaxID=235627 RepID=UPI0027819EC5|nr:MULTISPECIES: branched-chain amino acid ABC transporter permease [unclassified Arthrobacter]MDQ0821419.1 branched-chain amino acid transport system permease protein [Arthrobacter sp. V1I7]MDQ0855685.1 branched-chain amino acid transport system permease protein [Arthrobacter sp. V4I6]
MNSFIQLTASGVSLGILYALVAIGFAVLLKATGHFNMLPGALVLLGAYLTYQFHVLWKLDFVLAVALAAVGCAALGVLGERFLFSRLSGKGHKSIEHMSVLLVSLGLISIAQAAVVSIWGPLNYLIEDPWGLDVVRLGGIAIAVRDIWCVLLSLMLLGVFYYIIQHTRIGVGMRAAANDPEAARAQGINPHVISATAWAMCGAASALAGMMLSTEIGGGLVANLDQVAFTALPALILGGLSSLPGCVYGGLTLGLAQTYAAGYAPDTFGQGFATTLPWVGLILLLLVKPDGFAKKLETRKA